MEFLDRHKCEVYRCAEPAEAEVINFGVPRLLCKVHELRFYNELTERKLQESKVDGMSSKRL